MGARFLCIILCATALRQLLLVLSDPIGQLNKIGNR